MSKVDETKMKPGFIIFLIFTSLIGILLLYKIANIPTFEDYVEMDVQGEPIDCEDLTASDYYFGSDEWGFDDSRRNYWRLIDHEFATGIKIQQCAAESAQQLKSRCTDVIEDLVTGNGSLSAIDKEGKYEYCQSYYTDWIDSVTLDASWDTLFTGRMVESGLYSYRLNYRDDGKKQLINPSYITTISTFSFAESPEKSYTIKVPYIVSALVNEKYGTGWYHYFFTDSGERDKFVLQLSSLTNVSE